MGMGMGQTIVMESGTSSFRSHQRCATTTTAITTTISNHSHYHHHHLHHHHVPPNKRSHRQMHIGLYETGAKHFAKFSGSVSQEILCFVVETGEDCRALAIAIAITITISVYYSEL